MEEQYYYYIINEASRSQKDLKQGPRILRILKENRYLKFDDGEGPFLSLSELKKNSKIFKELNDKGENKRINQIFDDKNIIKGTIDNLIITEENESYPIEFINAFLHSVSGGIDKNGKPVGLHFYNNKKMRFLKQLTQEDKFGVWKGLVEIYDENAEQWKEKISLFFPKSWSVDTCFHECDYAYKNMRKSLTKKHIFFSETMSGIPVEIIVIDSKVKSIYPIYQSQ